MKTTILILAATTISLLAQGPLAPPAAPAPSMKTLAEIEARTPIPASPAAPIAGPHFTITQPGSYYLTGNITVTSGDGIVINAASDVSIDLNGFTIRSAAINISGTAAIFCPLSFRRLTVKNGSLVSGSTPPATLRGFQYGIYSYWTLSDSLISHVHIHGMANSGLVLDAWSLVQSCTASYNGGTGISAADSSVTNCRASYNFRNGIQVTAGVVAHCVASGNSTDPSNTHKQIEVSAAGQRDACVPATE